MQSDLERMDTDIASDIERATRSVQVEQDADE